jgi:hypothetical protein
VFLLLRERQCLISSSDSRIQLGEHEDAPVLGEVYPDYEQLVLDQLAPYYNLHVRSKCCLSLATVEILINFHRSWREDG